MSLRPRVRGRLAEGLFRQGLRPVCLRDRPFALYCGPWRKARTALRKRELVFECPGFRARIGSVPTFLASQYLRYLSIIHEMRNQMDL